MSHPCCTRFGLRAIGTALAGVTVLCGCRSLDRFDSRPGEAYCGALVSAEFVRAGLLPDNSRPILNLRLTLDTSKLDSIPARVSSDDAVRGLCAPQPLFRDAPLRAIEQVSNDDLSLLEFGQGREHNFLAWVDSNCTATMLAIVSLMKDDSVELRLLKPAALLPSGGEPAATPGFGIFKLHRQSGSCEF